jgi:UDPglucose 6-dehydrogenase
MKVSIIGTGYVGLVTGACLADVGNHVLCFDVDQRKIAKLRAGEIPIFEPGLKEIVRNNVASGRLAFTTDARESATYAKLQMIAVGTPRRSRRAAPRTTSPWCRIPNSSRRAPRWRTSCVPTAS